MVRRRAAPPLAPRTSSPPASCVGPHLSRSPAPPRTSTLRHPLLGDSAPPPAPRPASTPARAPAPPSLRRAPLRPLHPPLRRAAPVPARVPTPLRSSLPLRRTPCGKVAGEACAVGSREWQPMSGQRCRAWALPYWSIVQTSERREELKKVKKLSFEAKLNYRRLVIHTLILLEGRQWY